MPLPIAMIDAIKDLDAKGTAAAAAVATSADLDQKADAAILAAKLGQTDMARANDDLEKSSAALKTIVDQFVSNIENPPSPPTPVEPPTPTPDPEPAPPIEPAPEDLPL